MPKSAKQDFADIGSREWLVVCGTGGALGWKLQSDQVVGLRAGAGAVHVQRGVPIALDDQEPGVAEFVAGGLRVS